MTTIHGSLIKTEHDYNLQHVLVMKYVGARYENHTTFYDSLEDRTYVVIIKAILWLWLL